MTLLPVALAGPAPGPVARGPAGRLSLLALLAALALLARVREVPTRLLEPRRRGREVAVDVDVLVRGLECLTQAVEGFLRGRVVAVGEALDRVAERLARGTRRLARLRLELGQLRGEVPLLLVAHPSSSSPA